jgi:beta-phosphoglucomutase-like phosphatase (HAD superfamily)
MNFRGMMVKLQEKHNFKMEAAEIDSYVDMEVDRVVAKLLEKAVECPGVTTELDKMKAANFPQAVVSTSAKPRVIASLKKTGLGEGKYWSDDHVYSAATSLNPPSSKPDPKIYLYACEQLGVKPEDAVAVEDSKSGATAAMRAGIPTIGYVGIYGIEEGKEKMEEMAKILKEQCNVKTIMYDWKNFQQHLKEVDPTWKL